MRTCTAIKRIEDNVSELVEQDRSEEKGNKSSTKSSIDKGQ